MARLSLMAETPLGSLQSTRRTLMMTYLLSSAITRLRVVFINIAVLAGILVLLEGVAGYGLFAGRIALMPQLAERRHTQYDAVLGWVNTPGDFVPDIYGPG